MSLPVDRPNADRLERRTLVPIDVTDNIISIFWIMAKKQTSY